MIRYCVKYARQKICEIEKSFLIMAHSGVLQICIEFRDEFIHMCFIDSSFGTSHCLIAHLKLIYSYLKVLELLLLY